MVKSDPVSLDTELAHNTVTKEVLYGSQIEEARIIIRRQRDEFRAEGGPRTVEHPAQDRAGALCAARGIPRQRLTGQMCFMLAILNSIQYMFVLPLKRQLVLTLNSTLHFPAIRMLGMSFVTARARMA